MTGKESASYINREGTYAIGQLSVRVRVTDAKKNFGRIDFLVTPMSGTGAQWVSEASVKLDKQRARRETPVPAKASQPPESGS